MIRRDYRDIFLGVERVRVEALGYSVARIHDGKIQLPLFEPVKQLGKWGFRDFDFNALEAELATNAI